MTEVNDTYHFSEFDEYIRQGEPDQKTRASLWQTAIGLQAVDGLQTSDYLRQTARRNIEGEISLDEAHDLIHRYYSQRSEHEERPDADTEEADRAASNISRILASQTLAFNTNGLIALHRRIFDGVFKHAGQLRTYDITKKEWVLHDDTVNYLNWEDLRAALDYDIEQERAFSYVGLSNDDIVRHVTSFVSGIWQIHPFGEGNTRTTAVFTILYLRSIGFKVENDLFANNAWYFRNALVRANYKNARLGIDYSPEYLERFFRNLLLGEQWDLRSRYLYINPPVEWQNQPNLSANPTSTPTSTEQVPNKYRTSKGQDSAGMDNLNIISIVRAVDYCQLSQKELMEKVGLKHRPTFLENYLNPAIQQGFVRMLYPDSPRHPRQKYLLTVKGQMMYNELITN